MAEMLMVFVTCERKEQAEEIAEKLVGEKLAACVNVVPGIRSCYVWEGKRTWSEEVLLVIKTMREKFEGVKKRVGEMHTYEVPEIVGVAVEHVAEKYLAWVRESVG